ncbi:hypothetical protein GCM10029964_078960 [Kibdelosporangium lantanae]
MVSWFGDDTANVRGDVAEAGCPHQTATSPASPATSAVRLRGRETMACSSGSGVQGQNRPQSTVVCQERATGQRRDS